MDSYKRLSIRYFIQLYIANDDYLGIDIDIIENFFNC